MKTGNLSTTLVFFLVILLMACGGETQPDTVAKNNEVEAPPVKETSEGPKTVKVYRTVVDELRLRERPNTESRVLMKLPLGQEVVSLDEVSDDTYTANLGGKKVTDVWRKVKLAYQTERTALEGWAFGGGLEEVVVTYDVMPDGSLQRNFDKEDYRKMSRILGLDLSERCYYSGTVGYRKTTTGLYLPNGPFQIRGEIAKEERHSDEHYIEDYAGTFNDGKLDGAVTKEVLGYEVEIEATIYFQDGRCLWGKMREEGEGMVSVAEVTEMANCTFRYLQDGLVLVEE